MNKYILIAVAVVALVLFVWRSDKPTEAPVGANYSFTYSAATGTPYSVGTTTAANTSTWTALRYSSSTPGSQGFVTFCDNADSGVSVNNPVYLGFGATSTKPFGYRLASGSCYTMTLANDNMFYGTVYAIASSAATTILEIYK